MSRQRKRGSRSQGAERPAPALLPEVSLDTLLDRRMEPIDGDTMAAAAELVERVAHGGESELRKLAEKFDRLERGARLVFERDQLEQARDRLPPDLRELLERTSVRIATFARAQLACLQPLDYVAAGVQMGHRVVPVETAGCYAPGGRHPYVSTVLMTVIPARVAGVREVWVACPDPRDEVLGAAAIAGADGVLAAGGAHGIAALAHGVGGPPACDAVVGPGNRWVTAAKALIAGHVRIDGLAGPSELLVLADASADPALVAADLIAQAEHDRDALPILVTMAPDLVDAVRTELAAQLEGLDTAAVARAALVRGGALVCDDADEAIAMCEQLAPEHLELVVTDPEEWAPRLSNFGTLFIGSGAAEVLGDYGAGPNHVLPTSGSAQAHSGLAVFTFLKFPTFMRRVATDPRSSGIEAEGVGTIEADRTGESAKGSAAVGEKDYATLVDDCETLARLEGLSGHAAAARLRRP